MLIPFLRREAVTVDLRIRLVWEHALAHVHRRKFKEIHGKLFDTWDKYEDDKIPTTQLLRRCRQAWAPFNTRPNPRRRHLKRNIDI
ncbi:hypothetical protein DPMN_006685 [Dreissena polymorpha]|uniref:Uncharacterized protein n=1 Tax=Dreissena polymorpha TaxID=45954 RepID=A0A9D4MSV2_DREPO|nr:hypothetical protein DPMN_006685 [Dreissena polymorpha]